MMTPIFLKKSPSKQDLSNLEDWFKKFKRMKGFNSPIPYINILDGGKVFHQKDIIKKLHLLGWECPQRSTNYMVWYTQSPIRLPKGFKVEFAYYGEDKEMMANFWMVQNKSFPVVDDNFNRTLDRMIRKNESPTKVVIIKSTRGKVAGAGLVSYNKKGAFLFCGAIMPTYRNRRLWDVLVSVRQSISAEHGAKLWISSSQNKLIMNKGDLIVKTSVFINTRNLPKTSS